MICPKCKAKIGLYRFEARTPYILAQGMTCPVCGYWKESGIVDRKRRKRIAKREETYHDVGRSK